jgi:hypothetical protein
MLLDYHLLHIRVNTAEAINLSLKSKLGLYFHPRENGLFSEWLFFLTSNLDLIEGFPHLVHFPRGNARLGTTFAGVMRPLKPYFPLYRSLRAIKMPICLAH